MAEMEVAVPTPVHTVTPPRKVPKPKNAAERKTRSDQIICEFDRLFPSATCALQHESPWQLLVATILSAQCTDERVNKVTPALFEKYPTIQDFANVWSVHRGMQQPSFKGTVCASYQEMRIAHLHDVIDRYIEEVPFERMP